MYRLLAELRRFLYSVFLRAYRRIRRSGISITVGSQVEILEHFEPVSPGVDAAFRNLLEAFFNDPARQLGTLTQHSLTEFEETSLDFIEQINDLETSRRIFHNLRIIWVDYMQRGRVPEAQLYLSRISQAVLAAERDRGFRIHKGANYYFWGGTAILEGDLDRGFLLVHRSYQEGVASRVREPTPAHKLVTLNFDDPYQFFGLIVRQWAQYLEGFFPTYAAHRGSAFSLDDFRDSFLVNNPDIETIFAFTHVIARLQQLDDVSDQTMSGEFAGQFALNLLFDLVLVIDAAIKQKYQAPTGTGVDFPDLLSHLSTSASLGLSSGHLTNTVNASIQTPPAFDQTMLQLLQRAFPFTHTQASPALESDLAISYCIRNRAAHNVISSLVVAGHFQDVLQSVLNVLFLTSETLYPCEPFGDIAYTIFQGHG